MGWNGGGISARVVSRCGFNRHYFEIFEGQSKRFGDRLRYCAPLWAHGWPFAASVTAALSLRF